MTVDSPPLVDTEYAAAYLGATVATINKKCRTGQLPAVKFGHRWYIRKDRLEQMFDPSSPVHDPASFVSPDARVATDVARGDSQ